MRTPCLRKIKMTFATMAVATINLGITFGQSAGSPPAATTVATPDLAATIAAMVSEPAVSRTHWAVMVTTMDGRPIVSLNEGQLFQPASNAKLFTTAATLALLKGESRFETRIVATEAPVAGRLKGDLILQGDGDANLSGRIIPYAEPPSKQVRVPPLHILDEMAEKIAATGLRTIDGNIIGDDTLFPWEPYPQEWSSDDLLWGYGAPVSALTVSDNQIRLTIAPGKLPPIRAAHQIDGPTPAKITLDPATCFYTIQNDIVTGEPKSRTSVGIERLTGSRVLRLYGTIAENAAPETDEIAIDDPAEYAAISLKERLEALGITITGKAIAHHNLSTATSSFLEQVRSPIPALGAGTTGTVAPCLRCNITRAYADGEVLVSHTSPTVAEDVTVTNKESQNLHAELLLHQLAVAFSSDGSTAQGARVIRQFLVNAGIDPADFFFYDGSGLSGHDLVTPRAIAKLLQFASTQPWYAAYKSSLPIGGVDGSLEHRFNASPLKGHVFAKTGTLGEARALSGYLECASGRTVIFSIMSGNHAPGTSADRDVMDRIVAAIAASE